MCMDHEFELKSHEDEEELQKERVLAGFRLPVRVGLTPEYVVRFSDSLVMLLISKFWLLMSNEHCSMTCMVDNKVLSHFPCELRLRYGSEC